MTNHFDCKPNIDKNCAIFSNFCGKYEHNCGDHNIEENFQNINNEKFKKKNIQEPNKYESSNNSMKICVRRQNCNTLLDKCMQKLKNNQEALSYSKNIPGDALFCKPDHSNSVEVIYDGTKRLFNYSDDSFTATSHKIDIPSKEASARENTPGDGAASSIVKNSQTIKVSKQPDLSNMLLKPFIKIPTNNVIDDETLMETDFNKEILLNTKAIKNIILKNLPQVNIKELKDFIIDIAKKYISSVKYVQTNEKPVSEKGTQTEIRKLLFQNNALPNPQLHPRQSRLISTNKNIFLSGFEMSRLSINCPVKHCSCLLCVSEFSKHIKSRHIQIPLIVAFPGKLVSISLDPWDIRHDEIHCSHFFMVEGIIRNLRGNAFNSLLPISVMSSKIVFSFAKDLFSHKCALHEFFVIWLSGLNLKNAPIFCSIGTSSKYGQFKSRTLYYGPIHSYHEKQDVDTIFRNGQALMISKNQWHKLTKYASDKIELQITIHKMF